MTIPRPPKNYALTIWVSHTSDWRLYVRRASRFRKPKDYISVLNVCGTLEEVICKYKEWLNHV